MFLREVPIGELQTGDQVESFRGRPGRILMLDDWGITGFYYFIIWSFEGPWANEKQLVSPDATSHGMDPDEYPIGGTDIRYIGRSEV